MKNPFYVDRIPEWMTASMMLLAFLQLMTLSSWETAEGYVLFEVLGIHKLVAIYFMGFIGLVRLIALYINGAWKRTPLIRAVGSIIGAMFFTAIVLGGYLPALPLIIADVFAANRAGQDGRRTFRK